MIQIRQKRQSHRQSIRRQYLDNHFRQLRKKYFNFGNGSNNTSNHSKSIFQILLEDSLEFNRLTMKIREENFLPELDQLINSTLQSQNLYEIKFLLTIISNMFKDKLDVNEKEALFRLSFMLFEPLNLANFNPQNKQQRTFFEKVCQKVGVEILTFYMAGANSIAQFLNEQDQIRIQQTIYPAFVNVLLYGLSIPEKLAQIDEIQGDVWDFCTAIFDLDAEFYEDANRQKALRLTSLFIEIIRGHEWHLRNNEAIYVCFPKVMSAFFWLYDIILSFFSQVPQYFKSLEILSIIELTFREEANKEDEKCMRQVYSILRSLIDEKIFLKQIQFILLKSQGPSHCSGFKRLMKSALSRSVPPYRAVELLQTIVVSFFEESYFRQLIDKFALDLVELCCDIIQNFDQTSIGNQKNRLMIRRAITILKVLIEKGNVERNENESNILFQHFERNSGEKALTVIYDWFMELDARQDSDIDCILQDINHILAEDLQSPLQNGPETWQNEI